MNSFQTMRNQTMDKQKKIQIHKPERRRWYSFGTISFPSSI
jgi:hypothetical protein